MKNNVYRKIIHFTNTYERGGGGVNGCNNKLLRTYCRPPMLDMYEYLYNMYKTIYCVICGTYKYT